MISAEIPFSPPQLATLLVLHVLEIQHSVLHVPVTGLAWTANVSPLVLLEHSPLVVPACLVIPIARPAHRVVRSTNVLRVYQVDQFSRTAGVSRPARRITISIKPEGHVENVTIHARAARVLVHRIAWHV